MSNTNQFYIEKYKDIDEILKTYYQIKDNKTLINIDGVINPIKIDNRNIASVTDNQGSTPHCSAYSVANMFEMIYWKRTGKLINLNADQIYAHAKIADGKPDSDGVHLNYAMAAAANLCGIVNDVKIQLQYNNSSEQTLETIKFLIHKFDVIQAGFRITTGWNSVTKKDFTIKHTDIPLGSHAVLIVGYDPIGVYIQNSWGKEWGFKGFAIVPWDQVLSDLIYFCYISNLYELKFENI